MFLESHQVSQDSQSDMQHCREEDVEQQQWDDVALTEALLDIKPLRELVTVRKHASSHAIAELVVDKEYNGRDATSLQNVLHEGAVYGAVRCREFDEAHRIL